MLRARLLEQEIQKEMIKSKNLKPKRYWQGPPNKILRFTTISTSKSLRNKLETQIKKLF